ncbi:MAG: glycoside hydrolase family 3 N-terminal domain-containing protein, partial [Gemmatimonadaceae bacterium]
MQLHVELARQLRRRAIVLLAALSLPAASATGQRSAGADTLPFLDPARTIETRVSDLLARMTLPEKISQMMDHAPAIPRLQVPSYVWWNESLHGVAFAGNATNFPQVIGMAATFDAALVRRIGDVTATEARAKYHAAVRANDRSWFYGLTFWAPNVNIFRDPRWGRGQETYGEDPFLTSRLGVAFVSGMQGNDPQHLKVVATPKHFAVHSGPEPVRHKFNVDVSPHDLGDTYLPAFRATVTEGHAGSVMCAYNAINGVPACASTGLLQDHLRRDWGFTGYVVSDCAAVADITTGHKYAGDLAHAAASALKAGTDLECGSTPSLAYPALADALTQKLITMDDIDTALRRLLTARFQLGMFDPDQSYANGRTPVTEINSAAHRALSLQAARESMVLLRNERGILPLSSGARRILVVGPTAELVQSLQGNYNGTPLHPVTPMAGIEKRFTRATVTYAQGSVLVDSLPAPIAHSALHTGTAEGLKGEYFANAELRGTPAVVRIDRLINFNWDKSVPVAGLGRNDFSVRWTGTLTPPAAGDYRIDARVSNCYGCQVPESYRVFLDDTLVAEGVSPDFRGTAVGNANKRVATVHFTDTRSHKIRLEYVHRGGGAAIDLRWLPPAATLRAEAVAAAH